MDSFGRNANSGMRRTVKAHLLASQELLVESLYNISPLLDRLLACSLLSQDNYYEVRAETTPPNRARRLLEILHAQMDEDGACCFLECLRRCQHHYPRLRTWLSQDKAIHRGPTECQLQAQLSVLCARLGHSMLPVSLALFSAGTLTQYELERVQAAPTLYQQAHTLLTVCLGKGESACRAFYSALEAEDDSLAQEIRAGASAESLPGESEESEAAEMNFPIAVEETRAGAEGETPLATQADTRVATAETQTQSGVLEEVLRQLCVERGTAWLSVERGEPRVGVDKGAARLDICELGVMLGLPRCSVRGGVLEEEVVVADADQVGVLVGLFLQKTQDAQLLLCRVQQCNIQRAQLSERGCLLLKLLQEAELLLYHRDFLQARNQDGAQTHLATLQARSRDGAQTHLATLQARSQDGAQTHLATLQARSHTTLETIFSFLLWDCMAQVLEVPVCESSSGRSVLACVAALRASQVVDACLLQELEECWQDGGVEPLRQVVRVLAQLVRDLHPLQDRLHLLRQRDSLHLFAPGGETYTCQPRRLHRVTRFTGLPARVVRRAAGGNAFSLASASADNRSLTTLYGDMCARVVRLLQLVSAAAGEVIEPRDDTDISSVTQCLKVTLSQTAFSSEAFDAGMRHHLLGLLQFPPDQALPEPVGQAPMVAALMQLHLNTLSSLECYLSPGEHHTFCFLLESVHMLGEEQLCYAERMRGPVAIDNGIEVVFRFTTSEPASFLVRISCHGYDNGARWFQACRPQCVRLSSRDWAKLGAVEGQADCVVVAEVGGSVWVRPRVVGWREKLQADTQRNGLALHDQGCCFKVTGHGTEGTVKFVYRSGRISASAVTNCDVL